VRGPRRDPTASSGGGILPRLLLAWAWLLGWHLLHAQIDCPGLLLTALVPGVLITLSMAEHGFLRRRAFLQVYLEPTGMLYRLLRGGVWMLTWQIIKALFLTVILLVEAVSWERALWIVLGLDLLLVTGLYRWLTRRLEKQVQSDFVAMLTRDYLIKLNAGLLFVVILIGSFYLPQPDYRGLTLPEAVEYQTAQSGVGCAAFSALTRLAAAKDAAAWWAARHWLGTLRDPNLSLLGWIVFLASTGLASWAYSRMLLGTLINPLELPARLRPRPVRGEPESRGQCPAKGPPREDRRPKRNFVLVGFVVTVLTLALLSVYAALEAARQLADSRLAPDNLIRIVINGKVAHLPVGAGIRLEPQLREELVAQERAAIRDLSTEIDRRLDPIFTAALGQIPAFTDWYYSLQGEYSRYAALLAGSDVAEYLGERFRDTVLQPARLESSLDTQLAGLDAYSTARIREGQAALLEKATTLIRAERVPAPGAQDAAHVEKHVDLSGLISEHLGIGGGHITQEAISGVVAVGVGTAVAKGLGTVVAKKIVANVVGTKSFQAAAALLGKLVAKTAAKETGAAGAALTGVTICSPGGLAALVCGAIAGTVAWVAVDKAFIELDEALNREQFETDIGDVILKERDLLKVQLRDAYERLITSRYRGTGQALSEALRPADRPPTPPGRFVPAEAL
jgi:hypothetical protein